MVSWMRRTRLTRLVSEAGWANLRRFSMIVEALWMLLHIFSTHSLRKDGGTSSSRRNWADEEQTARGLRISWAIPPAIIPRDVSFWDWSSLISSFRLSP